MFDIVGGSLIIAKWVLNSCSKVFFCFNWWYLFHSVWFTTLHFFWRCWVFIILL